METFLVYLAVGAMAGIVAGLFGVGGGLIIVPVLVYVFTQQGLDPNVLVHMAIGTSLATIVLTSISSVYAHHRRGAVQWTIFWRLTPGIVIGALLGAMIADWMSSILLRRFFAVFEWAVGIQLLLNIKANPTRVVPGRSGLFAVGGVIGSVSSIVGIGGGTLTVPFLVWCNTLMQKAVATSSACGLPIALAGALGYVVTGWSATGQLAWSVGYLYLPAFIGVALSSVLLAPLGAWLAHTLPGEKLKRLFGLFLLGLGSYMFLAT
ncbi:MAG: sulfite exporter TauE/SafE family protein [Thioalkalispiraceae bacterium]